MRKNSVSSLFLMELILAIFFFSLASTVCIQLFVQAHLISRNSVNLNHAVMNIQNFAEAYNGCDTSLNSMAPLISEYVDINGNSIELYYDSVWNPVPSSQQSTASFLITLVSNCQNGLKSADINCIDLSNNSTIYQVTCEKYLSQESCQ